MNTMVVMVRCGALDPDYTWKELASFESEQVKYTLLSTISVINPEHTNYMLEIRVEDIIVRQAKVGMISTATKGISYEFVTEYKGMRDWFLNCKNQYLNQGDDWFLYAMTIGEMFHMTDIQKLASNVYEYNQRNQLFGIDNKFEIEFKGLEVKPTFNENVPTNDDSKDIKLDDFWLEALEDDDDDISD